MDEYVRSQLEFLRQLSDLDSRVSELQANINQKKTSLAQLEKELSKNREEYSVLSGRIKIIEHEEHSGEIKLKETEEELKKVQILLNSAQRNEEFSILLKKRDSIRSQISALEDAALEKLSEIDSERARLAKLTQELAREENQLKASSKQTEEDVFALQSEVDKLMLQRQELTSKISSETLTRYERVLNKEKRKVVVSIKDGICQGCYRSIPPEQVNIIMRGDLLVYCRNCNRILYIEETQQQSPPAEGGSTPNSSK
jgi:hypothetical protein